MLKAGTLVRVNVTPAGLRESLPAANWITRATTVRLIDDAPFQSTLDVIDVEVLNPGRFGDLGGLDLDNLSVYDFNIVWAPVEEVVCG